MATSASKKSINPKSKVWKYYDDVQDGQHVKCLICMEEKEKVHLVKASAGSTSSMIFHLKQHKKEFKSFEEETEMQENENKKKNLAKKIATLELGIGNKSLVIESNAKQPKVNELFVKLSKYSRNGHVQTKFDNAVLELLSVNCLPFSLVDTPEWKALIELLDKRITVKSRVTYQRKMTVLADKVLKRVKKMIERHLDVSCAITSDIWTSRSGDAYISGTLHFIDKKFRLLHWTPVC